MISTRSTRLHEKYIYQYKEADKSVKRMVRADRRAFVEELANESESAEARGEQSQLYKISRQICGKFYHNVNAPIRDKQGKLLTDETEQNARWAEHFKEILNREPPTEEAIISDNQTELDINIEPPTKGEIVNAINSLKNNKAPGVDNLNTELFKSDPETAAGIMEPLFRINRSGDNTQPCLTPVTMLKSSVHPPSVLTEQVEP